MERFNAVETAEPRPLRTQVAEFLAYRYSFYDSGDFMSIYVGNLSYEVTSDDLNEVFAEYGTVSRVQVPMDRETGKMRGFAFVEMASEAEEAAAIAALDGAEWMGRDLKVNKAKPREDNKRSSGGGGGWGDKDRSSRRY
jgi:RNA recognition motif-containing protein